MHDAKIAYRPGRYHDERYNRRQRSAGDGAPPAGFDEPEDSRDRYQEEALAADQGGRPNRQAEQEEQREGECRAASNRQRRQQERQGDEEGERHLR